MNSPTWTDVLPDSKAHQHVYRLLTDVANLAGYAEPVTAQIELDFFAYRSRRAVIAGWLSNCSTG